MLQDHRAIAEILREVNEFCKKNNDINNTFFVELSNRCLVATERLANYFERKEKEARVINHNCYVDKKTDKLIWKPAFPKKDWLELAGGVKNG